MTAPTQAQIEAIRRTLWSSSCFRDVCQMLPCQCAEEIAALTAAAEAEPVGLTKVQLSDENRHSIGHARYLVERASPDDPEVCFDYEVVADLLRIIDRLITAAAEAGKTELEALEEHQAMLLEQAEIKAATIERCARVAYDCATGIEACRKIRALKDQP